MQVDLIQSNSILGSFVTTTNLKIDRKIQFSTSVGETGNGSVFLEFKEATILTYPNRHIESIEIILFN